MHSSSTPLPENRYQATGNNPRYRNPENDARVTTFGVAYKPIPQTVIKVDWQNVTNRARTGVDQLNVALGYIF